MSVFFLRKKLFIITGYILSFLITATSLICAVIINNAYVYKHERNFYFLVSENPHLQVSGFEIQMENGAGYLVESGDDKYIALSVYLRESDGNKALESASERFDDLKVLSIGSANLYFKNRTEKREATSIINGLNTLLGGIRALNNEITRLEKGATQESSKRVLTDVAKPLGYLGTENEYFQSAGAIAVDTINKSIADIVYLKDLRYLLCQLCMEYTRICSKFSL